MPIEFQAPQPLSVPVTQGYGSAEQQTRDLPTLASLYEAGARLDAQTRQANADRTQHASEAAADRQAQLGMAHARAGNQGALQANQERTQVGLAQMQLQDRANQFNAEAQQQASLIQRRAEAQAWLNGQEISQAETLRYQRLNAQVATIEDEFQNGNIDEDQRAALVLQARTGIDQYKLRQEAAQEKLRVAQEKQLMHRNSLLEVMRGEDRAAAAQAARRLTFTLPGKVDEDGNPHLYTTDHQGNVKLVEDPKAPGTSGADRLKLQQQRLELGAATRGHLSSDQYFKAYNAAAAEVDKRIAASESGLNADTRTAAVASALDARGIARSWPEQHALQQAELRQMGLLGGPEHGGGPQSPQPPQGGQPQGRSPEQAMKEDPPFDLRSPSSVEAMTPKQQAQVDGLRDQRRLFASYDVPEAQKEHFREHADWAARALGTFGSIDAMPRDVKLQYARVLAALNANLIEHAPRPQSKGRSGGGAAPPDLFRQQLVGF